MGKIVPALLVVFGLGSGIGAGFVLRPTPTPTVAVDSCEEGAVARPAQMDTGEVPENGPRTSDFVKMNNQFVIPVVKGADVVALVVMSLSIEVKTGSSEAVYQREPRLRDAFLQVMFDHANAGGFDGAFTSGPNMGTLRQALLEVSRSTLGKDALDILITDLARQDM